MVQKHVIRAFYLVFGVLLLQANSLAQPVVDRPAEPLAVFTVQSAGKLAIARVLTRAASCPAVVWNGKYAQAMTARAAPATVAVRGDAAQSDNKPAVFDVLTCEAIWPRGITSARVGQRAVPSPRAAINRIVLIADTGCRMKATDKAFQPCTDAKSWPFAQVSKSAAALKPDLVVHIGDIHYRESPCPADMAACANSPWGYGVDAWQADFFDPARPLLAAAPWVLVRGNHESCTRAGQGWFRFMDAQPWTPQRSCNESAHDDDADFSEPYAVPLDAYSQFIVFDSSQSSGKAYQPGDPAFAKYSDAMKTVERLSKGKPNSIFLSHHPLQAVVPAKEGEGFKAAGSKGLQSVFSTAYPERLFPDGVTVAMHGHVHLFESISFKGRQPASLVLGNAGSANEGRVPTRLPPGTELYPGAEVQDYAARAEYGFATLDRQKGKPAGRWLLTEYTEMGVAVMRCQVADGKSRCKPVAQK